MRPAPAPDHSPDPLDRLWAATRPVDPSPATMDALWADAARELDRIEAARRSGTAPDDRLVLSSGRRRRVLAWVALAQAAAVLIGVGIARTRDGGDRPVVGTRPPAASSSPSPRSLVEVEPYQTMLVRIGAAGQKPSVVLLADPSAFPALPENTQHDMFDALESMAAL